MTTDVDIRIDIRRGHGVERIRVFADDQEQRLAGLRTLLSISNELDEIERKVSKGVELQPSKWRQALNG